jgi:ribosome-binding factor A
MQKESFRNRRVAELLRQEISKLVEYDVKDPRVKGTIIIDVKVTKDLSLARVYVRNMFGYDLDDVIEGLKSSSGFLISRLNKLIRIRKMPELEFLKDDTIDKAARIDELIEEIHKTDERNN